MSNRTFLQFAAGFFAALLIGFGAVSCDSPGDWDEEFNTSNNNGGTGQGGGGYDDSDDEDEEEDDGTHWVECVTCDGDGVCYFCGGDGVSSWGDECDYCDGTGICHHCDGAGRIYY